MRGPAFESSSRLAHLQLVPVDAQLGTLSNGLQKVSVLLAIVGRYRLSVLGEDGTLVSGRSFLLEVLPTFVHAKFCQLSGAGLSTALAGKGVAAGERLMPPPMSAAAADGSLPPITGPGAKYSAP